MKPILSVLTRIIFLFLFISIPGQVYPQPVNHWESLVRADNQWSYFTGISEPPSDWNTPEFNAATWLKGPGGIGYGDGDDLTVIPNVPSVFLRIIFQVPDPAKIPMALLYVDFDDGFVAYLNGTEIARANLGTPGIRPAYNQYATSTDYEAQLPSGGTPAVYALSSEQLKLLKTGTNLLALQVHNCNATSSDLSSTTWLIGGVSDNGFHYQALPAWFVKPQAYQSHLPLVVINTNGQTINNEPKITVNLKVIDKGPGAVNYTTDPGNQYDGLAGIEIRGQSSQMFPKKSYGFELRNAAGEDVNASLMGMPAEADWVLYAPYSDKTMLRNALTYYFGSRLGRWQPRFRFCEVYLNNSYTGVYQLIEKIKRDKERVNIAKMDPEDVSGDAVTGGYILKVDKISGLSSWEYFYNYPDIRFSNARNYAWSWVYPKAEDLVTGQKNWFMSYIKKVENSINGTSFADPVSGYAQYLDVPSFIDFQIMNELSNNVDGYRYSTFFHKERDSKGGKLFAGPLWDFDLCYGNVDYSPKNLATDQFEYYNYGPNEYNCMHWWFRLMMDPVYVKALRSRWNLLRQGPLHNDSIMGYIDAQTQWLGDAVTRNYAQWPILTSYVWPNSAVRNTYKAEIDFLREWLLRRLAWMDTQWYLNTTPEDSIPAIESFAVYPNPVADVLHIELPPVAKDYSVTLYDSRGSLVFTNTPEEYGTGRFKINCSGLGNGMYILKIHHPQTRPVIWKIMKQN